MANASPLLQRLAVLALLFALTPHAYADNTFLGVRPSSSPPLELGPRLNTPVSLVEPRTGDRMIPVNVSNRWGLINQRGRLIAYPRFDWTDFGFESNRARALLNNKTGYIRHDGDWVIRPRFDRADRFENDIAVVATLTGPASNPQQLVTFIDRRGQLITDEVFEQARRFKDNYAAVYRDQRAGFLNRAGDLAIPLRFAAARSFHQGFAAVQLVNRQGQPGRFAYIDTRGQPAHTFSAKVTALGDFNDNLARFRFTTPDGPRWGYLNRSFNAQIQPRFEDARDFTGGLAAVKLNGKWGYIDRGARFAIPPKFDNADDFDETLAMVMLDGKIGYVNKAGSLVIPPTFAQAEPQFNGLLRVQTTPSFSYLFYTGSALWDPRLAEQGFTNLTNRERAAVTVPSDSLVAPRTLSPPKPTRQADVPYRPEFLYDEGLPQPPDQRW
ncbi:MAG: WG repeat-containing protein [Planctomycetota bacterium]